MRKKLFVVLIFTLAAAIYLNRSYARIYNRDEANISNVSWPSQIIIKNPNYLNTVKYVSLGDSLTVGVGSKDITKTLPFIVASKLSQQMSVILINLAVSGATSEDVLVGQLDEAVAQKPNYITLFTGTNDIHSLISPSKFGENMNSIINFLIQKTAAKIIVFNIPYLGSEDLILFPYNLLLDYQVKQYNKILNSLSKNYKITLIDVYSPTKEKFSKQLNFYSSDNFHPSEEGYLLWGTLVGTKGF